MSPESFTLLQKEIDIMKDLDSQNVVKLIDVVRTGNNYYLVSELCTCGDLKEYMKKTVRLNISYYQ
jgi:serine/threonine-protein kinase ULK/ATG1